MKRDVVFLWQCYRPGVPMTDAERQRAAREAIMRERRSGVVLPPCDAFAAPAHNPGARVVPTGGGR